MHVAIWGTNLIKSSLHNMAPLVLGRPSLLIQAKVGLTTRDRLVDIHDALDVLVNAGRVCPCILVRLDQTPVLRHLQDDI